MSRLFSIASLASALMLAGCLTIPDDVFQCGSDVDCPDDFGCFGGRCFKLGGDEWTCRSGEIISLRGLCDAIPHCADGSDEAKCSTFECKDGSKTLRTAQVCDGQLDCEDGSDEGDCDPVPCLDSGSEATDTRVPFAWLCDGDRDCPGYALDPDRAIDEDQCLVCDDLTTPVHSYAYCDGIDDCPDRSDEIECFYCDALVGSDRIPRWQICDQTAHCRGGADQMGCATFACGAAEVPAIYVCDGSPDCCGGAPCAAGSTVVGDEDAAANCQLDGYDPEPGKSWPATHTCTDRAGNSRTFPTWVLCQGLVECADGSDEMRMNCPFICNDGTRIPREWVCNGIDDCPSGEDEGGTLVPGLCPEG